MSSVRTNIHEPDPKLRIKMLYFDYRTFLRNRKLDSLILTEPKFAVEHICSVIKSPPLKFSTEVDLSFAKRSLLKNWKEFYKHDVQKKIAINCDGYCTINQPLGKNTPSKRKNGDQYNPDTMKNPPEPNNPKKNPPKNSDVLPKSPLERPNPLNLRKVPPRSS